jgi:glyoxylase-like metal-dependent hydrolase (beta-lactamase superfamily II)
VKSLTANVLVETELRGSNHGLVTTADGLVLIDGPHKPSDTLRLKAEIERRGRLRYILNTEPHGDHWTSNAYFDVPVVAHEGVRSRILATDMKEHVARVATFGPEEPKLLEGYRPNAPVITFQKEMKLHVGHHTFRMVSMPGHTPYQAAVIVEEEGVVSPATTSSAKSTRGSRRPTPASGSRRSTRWARSARTPSCPAMGPCATSGISTSRRRSFANGWTTCAAPSNAG